MEEEELGGEQETKVKSLQPGDVPALSALSGGSRCLSTQLPREGKGLGRERTHLNIRTESNVADSFPRDDSANTDPGPPGGQQPLLDSGHRTPRIQKGNGSGASAAVYAACVNTQSLSMLLPAPAESGSPGSTSGPRPPAPGGCPQPQRSAVGSWFTSFIVSELGLNSSTISYRF